MHEILGEIDNWIANGHKIALATVAQTWGSAPRRAGAKMAITEQMAISGSVSGGCVENAVITEALRVIETRHSQLLKFGVSDEDAWGVGLTCGGKISVFVEPLLEDWWALIDDYVRRDRDIAIVTIVDGKGIGGKVLLDGSHNVIYRCPELTVDQAQNLQRIARNHAGSALVELSDCVVMVDYQRPRPKLVIVGGAHVAIPLQKFAGELGFRVYVVDPRKVFAAPERFPNAQAIYHRYPQRAFDEIGIDDNAYVVVLTHDPKIDDPALIVALKRRAPYVGVLSSGRTHERRLKRLREAGLDEASLREIRAPIGIDIGASNPEEIALCIMAEIIAVRNEARV